MENNPIRGHSSTQTRCETTLQLKKRVLKLCQHPWSHTATSIWWNLGSFSCGHPQSEISNKVGFQFTRGYAMAQLVEALPYKPEGRGFDFRWRPWNFSLTSSFWPHYGPGVDSASNTNEYQEYFLRGKGGRCVGLTTLPPSYADCLEIWEPQPPVTLWACLGL